MPLETPASTAPARPATQRRLAKREALFAEAAHQLNEHGAGSVVLSQIARAVGLSRNALYYYAADRADLVFHSYARSCQLAAADIEAAAAKPGAEQAIAALVERTLAFDRPAAAVLSDVDVLDEPRRVEIRALQARNTEAIRALFRRGVTQGLFRPHDDEVVAQSLAGMLSWALLSARWTNREDGPHVRQVAIATICAILFDGLATPGQSLPDRRIDLNSLLLRPFDAFDRRQSGEIKMQQLLAAASRLFNRKGIDGASLDEIGVEIGATKGVIYHYFKDKTDLAVSCYLRALELHETFQAASYAQEGSAVHRLASMMDLSCQAYTGAWSPLMLQPGFFNLPDQARETIIQGMRGISGAWVEQFNAGVAEGGFRPLDPAHAAVAAAGLFTWLPKWRTPDHRLSPTQLSEEIVALLMLGLRTPRR